MHLKNLFVYTKKRNRRMGVGFLVVKVLENHNAFIVVEEQEAKAGSLNCTCQLACRKGAWNRT
jgi:hypothetical protein